MTLNKQSALLWFHIVTLMLVSTIAQAQTTAFKRMLDELLDGTVPVIDARALETRLSESSAPVLLDAREPDEYAVSHLQGARNVGFEEFDPSILEDIDKDAPIVIYCSGNPPIFNRI